MIGYEQHSPLRCPRCFSAQVQHRVRRHAGEEQWSNWCPVCQWEGEYLPTPEEIQRECQRIRAAQGPVVDDEEEKALRRLGVKFEEDLLQPQEEDPWESELWEEGEVPGFPWSASSGFGSSGSRGEK